MQPSSSNPGSQQQWQNRHCKTAAAPGSNSNTRLREGQLVRKELLHSSGAGGLLDACDASAAASPEDVALIDCAAHTQANVTIRESSDCVYQQRLNHHHHHQHHHQNQQHHHKHHQHHQKQQTSDQKIHVMGGDVGIRAGGKTVVLKEGIVATTNTTIADATASVDTAAGNDGSA